MPDTPGFAVSSRQRHLARVAADVAAMAAARVRAETGHARLAGTKSTPTDVVTHSDIASETLIRSELLERCPGSSIVGEELADEVGVGAVQWIVDPIDGTVNFLYDLPVVSVSIAARIDGLVVAGAVADVIRGDVFAAALGEGATLDDVSIEPSDPAGFSQALIGTGFAYDADVRSEQAAIVSRILPAARDIRCMGSAALNLCWVGCGRLDGYYERGTKLYDYAAAAVIAAEAGATVELPTAASGWSVIAATPSAFTELRSHVTGVDAASVPPLE